MSSYYVERLCGSRLRKCYDLATPRVRQYLESEIEHVRERLRPEDEILELGCGYGRVALRLAEHVRRVVGVDVAEESLALARDLAGSGSRCEFLRMDATAMSFPDETFDVVVCVQNGVCAFGVEPRRLLAESLRVARTGGRVLLSTYSDAFWSERLSWFEAQSAAGLVGAVDRTATGDGVVVCDDGFRAGAFSREEFETLCAFAGVVGDITEVDGSSLFCEIVKPEWSAHEECVMKLDPEKHRIVRYVAQQLAAQRPGVSEATLAMSLGMVPDDLRRHLDELEGRFLSTEKRLDNENRWVRLSRRGEDYAHMHGLL